MDLGIRVPVILSVKTGDFVSQCRYIENIAVTRKPVICNGLSPKGEGFKAPDRLPNTCLRKSPEELRLPVSYRKPGYRLAK
jgi:hypothetical protein